MEMRYSISMGNVCTVQNMLLRVHNTREYPMRMRRPYMIICILYARITVMYMYIHAYYKEGRRSNMCHTKSRHMRTNAKLALAAVRYVDQIVRQSRKTNFRQAQR